MNNIFFGLYQFLKFVIIFSLLGFAYAQETPASKPVDLSHFQGKWTSESRPNDVLIFTKRKGRVGEEVGFWHGPNIPCFTKLTLNSSPRKAKPLSIEINEEIVLAPQGNCLISSFTLTKKQGQEQIQVVYDSSDIEGTYFKRDKRFVTDQAELESLAQELKESEVYNAVSNNDPDNSTDPSETDQLPFTGTLTLDEYDWFSTTAYLGVIDINIASGSKKRILNGKKPWRHESGKVVYLQGCSDRVTRVMLADEKGLSVQITPCSSEIDNPGYSPTDFSFSRLSPDQKKVAVEVYYYWDNGYLYSTMIFNVDQTLLATHEGFYAPTWLPDGRLLLTGEGFYLTDNDLQDLTRIDSGQLTGPVNNPDVHPSGNSIIFEYNQQIWQMNIDGSDLQERVYAGKYLRYPTWSPDGTAIAYLAKVQQDYYDRAIYFTDLVNSKSYALNLEPVLGSSSSIVPNGPLSWRE